MGKTKLKAYIKITVLMCCEIFDRKSVAPSSGNYRPVDEIRNFEEEKEKKIREKNSYTASAGEEGGGYRREFSISSVFFAGRPRRRALSPIY